MLMVDLPSREPPKGHAGASRHPIPAGDLRASGASQNQPDSEGRGASADFREQR